MTWEFCSQNWEENKNRKLHIRTAWSLQKSWTIIKPNPFVLKFTKQGNHSSSTSQQLCWCVRRVYMYTHTECILLGMLSIPKSSVGQFNNVFSVLNITLFHSETTNDQKIEKGVRETNDSTWKHQPRLTGDSRRFMTMHTLVDKQKFWNFYSNKYLLSHENKVTIWLCLTGKTYQTNAGEFYTVSALSNNK